MLVSRLVQIDFASSNIQAIDAIKDIRDAAEAAGLNLFSRYNVRLQYPMRTANDKVVVEILIPEEIINTFAVGNHLRGISSYLLKNLKDKYDHYKVGNRLLVYTELSELITKPEGLSVTERLEAVAEFARLLKRDDEDAMEYISQILTILKKAQ